MIWHHPNELARRGAVAAWVLCGTLGVVLAAFFRLQVLGQDRYALQSQQNRLRPVVVPAPRGWITDRNGVVIADNIPGFTVSLLPRSADSLRAVLGRMMPYAVLDSAQVASIMDRHRRRAVEPVVVLKDAPFEVVAALEERRVLFPGLVIQTEPKRRYLHGEATAHVLGYVNEITERELGDQTIEGARFGTLVGRSGLERQYDSRLRGKDGRRFVEVDARGRTVREEVQLSTPAEQGETIRTTIDIDLQEFIRQEFPEGSRGAMMAMDPRNGDILGLYSSPSFDANAFVGGIDQETWEYLRDSPDRPMLNRALQGRYPPASPFKLALAAMALRRGLATMRTRMATPCRGGMPYYTRYFRCWKAGGHGTLTLAEAIQHSCDVYFYQLGLRLDLPNLLTDGLAYGFAEKTGIDMPSEAVSRFPANTDYYDELFGPQGWTRAVTLNLSIGQGENAQTLINMMRFYAMLANDTGQSPVPRLLADAPVLFGSTSLDLPVASIVQLRQALVRVVERGTAVRSRVANLSIAGKTGTAQNPHGEDHGWFIGFAPADQPEIVVGAIVEFAEHGSDVAPLVTSVIARHLFGASDAPDGPVRLRVEADSAPVPVELGSDSLLGVAAAIDAVPRTR